jgi:hypothetical protein
MASLSGSPGKCNVRSSRITPQPSMLLGAGSITWMFSPVSQLRKGPAMLPDPEPMERAELTSTALSRAAEGSNPSAEFGPPVG